MMKQRALIISCEHAVNSIPKAYQPLFLGQEKRLNSHEGIDCGALEIARELSRHFDCHLTTATVSRLLIDCNRSLRQGRCFSNLTKNLLEQEQKAITEAYYLPYRRQTQGLIQREIEKGHQVFHLSVHSFTPVFQGVTRNADIGLLYDPRRVGEKQLAQGWKKRLQKEGDYRIRMNYPYLGRSDGFTSALRKRYEESIYLGLELESNQAILQIPANLKTLIQALIQSLENLLKPH